MSGQTAKNQPEEAVDQRYLPRWITDNNVVYKLENIRHTYKASLKDISCSGACIYAKQALNVGLNINLSIYFSKDTSINLDGTVIWIKPDRIENQVGIRFTNTSFKAQELILGHAFELDPKKLVKHWFQGWRMTEKEPF